MTPTSKPRFWIADLSRMIQRVLGISFNLTGLVIDDADLDLDLGYGRE